MSPPQRFGPPHDDGSYREIEDALGATARGRAFLAEHARRGRASDTRALLDAVARLEARVGGGRLGETDRTRLREIAAELADTVRRASADARDPEIGSGATGAVARIGDATERVQEAAWTMRERGFDAGICDELDACATAIHGANRVVDRAMGRAAILADAMEALERKLDRLSRIAGLATPEPSPQPDDRLGVDDLPVVASPDAPHSPDHPTRSDAGPVSAHEAALDALARLAALPTRDQLRLMT